MSRFVQLHLLTSYPPANLNRDDLDRPKTAMMGGEPRLRVSSQSLKRAWRTSEVFESSLKAHMGTRTKEMGIEIFKQLKEKGVGKKDASEWAKAIANQFGKLKAANKDNELQELEIEQLAHFSPEEKQAIEALINQLAERKTKPEDDELKLLRKTHTAVDIALFGRMLASAPAYNTEAAAQVAHAISVHSVVVEDDFFTAVDDLNKGEDDAGAAHLGETEFAAGLFYLYICIDKALLIKNLSNDEALANQTLKAFIESAATVSPNGKQNSFASRARTSYLLCETGNQQPRSLSVAFLKPVQKGDMLVDARKRLDNTLKNMDQVYGLCADKRERFYFNADEVEGNLQAVIQCAVEA
ncbi:MAG: type I-E CRISPR-associated protein Cas7/Cse4/CasC [Thiothrix sp.]|nr:MAG: type I-E CRISPR-associated protein Cas7/Cse4/CasC [Thiothrix sp.]